jgi:hypothetical protein
MTGEAEATSALNLPKRQFRLVEWQNVNFHAGMHHVGLMKQSKFKKHLCGPSYVYFKAVSTAVEETILAAMPPTTTQQAIHINSLLESLPPPPHFFNK